MHLILGDCWVLGDFWSLLKAIQGDLGRFKMSLMITKEIQCNYGGWSRHFRSETYQGVSGTPLNQRYFRDFSSGLRGFQEYFRFVEVSGAFGDI